jgi:dipeptidyl aminopeptidase/acylaminoacyl peptidase
MMESREKMTGKQSSPYGSWRSPISAEIVAASPMNWLGHLCTEGDQLFVLRAFPQQGGRGGVARVHFDGDRIEYEDITPTAYSVRSRVYEYGGQGFAVKDGVIYFSNFPDDRLYRQRPGEEPKPITSGGAMRYGDLTIDPVRNRLICVREDRRPMTTAPAGENAEPVHTIAAVNLNPDSTIVPSDREYYGTVLWEGADFVAFPTISPDGRQLAWVAWNHPNMPFFSSALWLADLADDGTLINPRQIVPECEESITDPRFSPDGILYFCSDRSNWWNLYRWIQNGTTEGMIESVCPIAAEFGNPYWNVGLTVYRFLSPTRILAPYNDCGTWHIGVIDTETHQMDKVPTPYTFIVRLATAGNVGYMIAGSPRLPRQLIRLDLTSGELRVLDSSVHYDIPPEDISPGQHIGFPTEHGLMAYGFYHPPVNRDFQAPANELPPLIVECHGGPTGSTKNALDMQVQYWTSRGFAVLCLNYGGSAGYGREYRNRLRNNWGVVDVNDAVNGARYLVEQGLVDPNRTIVRGGSAGGYLTFAALAFRNYFKAGSALFGISDLEVWHLETHKYESHYAETLVGPYPAMRDLYHERSPYRKANQINAPMIITQGSDDKVVPPNQSRFVADSLRTRGVPVVYLEFEGEAHGFRKFETVLTVLRSELTFFGRIFGFTPAHHLPALKIDNLPLVDAVK